MKQHLLILFVTFFPCIAWAQQESTKEQLKKKYDTTDIYKETARNLQSDNSYPDSLVLPPLHFVDTYTKLDTADIAFNSISVDVDVQTDIPDNYKFYISPFGSTINKMTFYCGIQTYSGGKPIHGGADIGLGRGGIFSRWLERNKAALKTDGYYASGNGEGDGIGVRNKLKWNKGLYRIRLYKSGYISGKPVPEKFTEKDLMFAWGDYEHSWVTMEVEDLKSHHKVIIGSLAFPGKKLMYSPDNYAFLEQYGMGINFSKKNYQSPTIIDYKNLPVIKVNLENFMVNGHRIKPLDVQTAHNGAHNPEQSKIPMPIPLLSTADYDATTGIIKYTTGKLQSWITPKE